MFSSLISFNIITFFISSVVVISLLCCDYLRQKPGKYYAVPCTNKR